MNLSKEAIEEFKEIYRKKFGREISNEEAFDAATRLTSFFEILLKSSPEGDDNISVPK